MTDKHDDCQNCANEHMPANNYPCLQCNDYDLYTPKEESQKTKVERHRDICIWLNELYAKKNHDYGDSFHQTFVEEGMAMARIRLGDKFNRFKTLSHNQDQKVADESIRDTLLDLANYAIMTVLEMDIQQEEP